MNACYSKNLSSIWTTGFLLLAFVSPVFAGHMHHEGMNMESHSSSHQVSPVTTTPPRPVNREAVMSNTQEPQKPQEKPKPNGLLLSGESSEQIYEEPPERHVENSHKKRAKAIVQTQTSVVKKKSLQEMASEYYTDSKK